jgi:Fic family protein
VAAAKAVAGTKIRWGKPRAGSSPAARTIFCLLDGFDGKLTSSKYGVLEKTSPDAALRDITGLVARGILTKDRGGRAQHQLFTGRGLS